MEKEENNLIKKSIDEIISMVNTGNIDAMNELGYRYFHGEGVEENKQKAFKLYSDASKKGSFKAKFNLALCYYKGEGIEKNYEISFDIFKELAEKYNDFRSYYYLGEFYFWGNFVEKDYEKAFFYYSEALKINPEYKKAKFCIGYAYYLGEGTEKNYEKAFNIFKELEEKDKYEGVDLYLGEMYMMGKGTNIDYKKAKEYFENMLDENNDDIYYKLALIYEKEENKEKVKEYLNKVESDLCASLIYYILALKNEEEYNLDEILKLLNLEMKKVKENIKNFPENHPAKKYYTRLKYLKNIEYNDIVEKLKSKIIIFKKENNMKDSLKKLCSDEDVINLVKSIVEKD